MGQNTMKREGGAVNTAAYMPHLSEEQAPAHTAFIIPDGLFVHNSKGHLGLATVRDRKLPEEWAQKGASEGGLSLGRVELLGLPVDHCLAKSAEGGGWL